MDGSAAGDSAAGCHKQYPGGEPPPDTTAYVGGIPGHGWPSLRYFNKDTGLKGKAYKQQSQEKLCDELGPHHTYMNRFVTSIGGAEEPGCSATDDLHVGCDDKDMEFIEMYKDKPLAEITAELDRLVALGDKDRRSQFIRMKKKWIKRPVAMMLLKQFIEATGDSGSGTKEEL
jgi:hypothetical protein